DEAALEVAPERGEGELRIEAQLAVRELRAAGLLVRLEKGPQDPAGDVPDDIVAVDEDAAVARVEHDVSPRDRIRLCIPAGRARVGSLRLFDVVGDDRAPQAERDVACDDFEERLLTLAVADLRTALDGEDAEELVLDDQRDDELALGVL